MIYLISAWAIFATVQWYWWENDWFELYRDYRDIMARPENDRRERR